MRLSHNSLLTACALAFSLTAGIAAAQTPAPAPMTTAPTTTAPMTTAPGTAAAPMAARPAHTRMTMKERFAAANTTNDGHLTLAQAQAGLPRVAQHFTEIDKTNKGYVTIDDLHAYMKALHASRHQTPASTNG